MNRFRPFFRSLPPVVQVLAAGAFVVVGAVLMFAALWDEIRWPNVLSGAVGSSFPVYVAALRGRRARA